MISLLSESRRDVIMTFTFLHRLNNTQDRHSQASGTWQRQGILCKRLGNGLALCANFRGLPLCVCLCERVCVQARTCLRACLFVGVGIYFYEKILLLAFPYKKKKINQM